MNTKIKQILLPLLPLAMMSGTASAEQVTSFTLEDVGSGGQGAYNATLDGFVGAFTFGPVTMIETIGIEFNGIGQPLANTSVSNVPFTVSNATAFTSGFLFAGQPFEPWLGFGPSIPAADPNIRQAGVGFEDAEIDITVVGGVPSLTIASNELAFPFGGLFGGLVSSPHFSLGPQSLADKLADCAANLIYRPMTTFWVNRIGETDTYQYAISWTHCITAQEDPGFQFVGFNAGWYLEGIMTTEDTVAPTLSGSVPGSGATHSSDAAVSVTFDEPMDPASVTTTSFTVAPDATNVSECTSIVASNNNKTFTCMPTGEFTQPALFSLTLSNTIQDDVSVVRDAALSTTNNAFAGTSFTFNMGPPNQVPPILQSSSPTDVEIDVAVDSAITLTYDSNLNVESADAISLNLDGTPVATDNVLVGAVVTLTPQANLSNNTVYTIEIDGTVPAPAVGNASGVVIGADQTITFTTEAAVAITDASSTVTLDAASVAAGASMVSVSELTPAQIGGTVPELVNFEDAFVGYTVNGVPPGGVITVTIDFASSIAGKPLYKVVNGVYTELVEGAAIGEFTRVDDDTITMTIQDDGPQDSETAIAGVITDPVGAGTPQEAPPTPGSLGCTTVTGTTVSPLDRMDMFLLLGLILWYGIARRKKA